MQLKKKKLLSRVVAITLAVITAVTTIPEPTIHAHASEVEDAAKNKGYGGVMPSPGDEWMGWYNQTQGYRIYVINPQLERITPVYDFYFRKPKDFYKGVASDYNVNYMRTTRFDSMSEDYYEEDMNWRGQEYTIDILVEWCKAKDAPPYPYKSSRPYAGQGDKFRDWFYAGQEGTALKGYDASSGGGGVYEPTGKKPSVIPTKTPDQTPDQTTGSTSTSKCTNCLGMGTIPCPVCNGTGDNIIVGPDYCNTCVGYGVINCRECSETVNCETCGRNMTDYYSIAFNDKKCLYCRYNIHHDGKCDTCGADCDKICYLNNIFAADCARLDTVIHREDMETCVNCWNGLKNCEVCGAGYAEGSECAYCKCPSCGTQMTLISNRRESVTKFYCSTCNKNVTYNTNDNTIKIAVPDNYWKLTSKLSYTTQTEIANAKTIIEQAENYTKGQYYTSNMSTIGNIDSVAKSMIQEKFNAKFNSESKISPHDALLYTISIVADIIHTNYPGDPYYAEEHKAAVNYEIYEAFKQIQDSQEYQDLYYTIQSLTSSISTTNQLYTSLLSNPIPLTDKSTEENVSKTPAINLINSGYIEFPNGDYIATEEKTAMQLAMEDGCLIVVEPLCGFRMKLGEENGKALWGKYWAYGSFWNIAQHWYGDKESYYTTFLTNLTNNCLVTGSDFETKDGYTIFAPVGANKAIDIQDSKKMMSSLSLMYEKELPIHGLSMHLYSMDVSETITFDDTLENPDITEATPYSHLIGASPDHTERVAEEKRSDPTKHANIVKFYETTDPATGETIYEIFSREIVPRKIEIVNEELTTGYKLIEWYTTDKLCINLSNPEITWEKLLNNDGFDKGNIGQLSTKFSWENGVPECILVMDTIERGKAATQGVEVVENTLYLLYRKGDATTSTYDELLKDQIGPSPDDTHKLVKETSLEGGEYLNKATIVKVYEELDQAGNVISTEVFTREPVPNTIEIEDESEKTGYELSEWFTGTLYLNTKEQTYQEFYDYYTEFFTKNSNVFIVREVSPDFVTSGEELFQTIKFTNEDGEETGEQVLYLHYIKSSNTLAITSTYDETLTSNPGKAPDDSKKLTEAQIEAGNYINIIKFYENPDEAYTHPAYQVFTRTPSPLIISIEDESAPTEPGYKLVDWFTSDQFVTLPDGELTPPSDKVYDDYKSDLKVLNEGDEEQIISFTDKIYLAGTTIEGANSLDHYGIQLVTGNTLYVLLKI